MNINSLFGNVATPSTTGIDAVTSSNATPSSVPPPPAAASATISTPGQLFSQMQQLSEQNPTEFKAVAAQIASAFQSAAGQASGPQAQLLTNLANQFTQASQTGTLPAPQSAQAAQAGQGGQSAQAAQAQQTGQAAQASSSGTSSSTGAHHHHHHHGGGGMMQSSSVQQAFQSAVDILQQATQDPSSTGASST